MEPDAVEIRVLGCLLEKQRTTPDAYPLTLNALRLACNQATNRDPVVDYDEATIRTGLRRLSDRRWARVASGAGSRAAKYRHLLDQALDLGDPELALLAVLMLRGPQTPGELKQRTERLHRFADASELRATLDGLIERDLVARLPRRPGEKQERHEHRLGGRAPEEEAPLAPLTSSEPKGAAPPEEGPLAERLERMERELGELRSKLDALRRDLGA